MKQLLPLLLLLCLSANAQEKFTVYFDFNEAELNTASNENLSQWILQNPDAVIREIYGYADMTGNAAYNQDLSERRAHYIYERLKTLKQGIGYSYSKGFGESRSVGNNAKNRKVEIYYDKVIRLKPLAPEHQEIELTQQFRQAKKGDIIRLKNVYFVGGTTYIIKECMPVLKELNNIMRNNPKLKIDIQGHICCDKDDIDNLSGRRAEEIFLYLTNNGIDRKRITTRGYGGHRPVYAIPEYNDEEMAQNRRVEIEILEN
jgi:outer membrane protein OmpA-like peptidoglycan-associated protein